MEISSGKDAKAVLAESDSLQSPVPSVHTPTLLLLLSRLQGWDMNRCARKHSPLSILGQLTDGDAGPSPREGHAHVLCAGNSIRTTGHLLSWVFVVKRDKGSLGYELFFETTASGGY